MAIDSTPPDIKSNSLDIFFARDYLVPAFQRNYTWGPKEVENLVDDLIDYFDNSTVPYYLLGDVILVRCDSSVGYDFEIIDGQQRITTLMLLFAAVYRFGKPHDPENEVLKDVWGLVYKHQKVRVRMSGQASDTTYAFISGKNMAEVPTETPSQKAALEAIDVINTKLASRFGDGKIGSLLDFAKVLQKKVYLSSLVLDDNEAAFEFYERVNDRGKPLSKTDLLKNRLLQKLSDDDFDNASDQWSDAEKRLMRFGREGTLTFLLRQLINADTREKTKESELFNAWKPYVTNHDQCNKLVERIERTSKVLENLLQGNTPKGSPDKASTATRFLKFSQNLGVKLAGETLSAEDFSYLNKRLEARALLSLFALERSQEFETKVVHWSNNVQKLVSPCTEKDLNNAIVISASDLDNLIERARVVTSGLRYGKTAGQTAKLRLLMAIVNVQLNKQAGNMHHYDLADLLVTSKKIRGQEHPGYDIEHIGAKSTAEAKLGDLVHSLGNLTLFRSIENRSEGNNDVEYKAESYSGSICYATALLSNTPIAVVESLLATYRTATVDDGIWNVEKVKERFDFYWNIFEAHLRESLEPTESDDE